MAEKIAKFRFTGHKIVESIIKLNNENIDPDLKVNFNQSIGVNEGEHKMRLELEVTIDDKNNALHLNVKSFGYFDFDIDLTDEEKDNFFRINAPSILFPYIRAYVTSLQL